MFADRYEPERLRELLPGVEFQRAIAVIEAIAAKTEDRLMYDQREKAQRDYQWALDGAREEGREAGRQEGREAGRQEGREAGRQEGREEGREEGLEIGSLAGKIQLLQQLLGEESSPTESLLEYSTGELSAFLVDLQQRLRSRDTQ